MSDESCVINWPADSILYVSAIYHQYVRHFAHHFTIKTEFSEVYQRSTCQQCGLRVGALSRVCVLPLYYSVVQFTVLCISNKFNKTVFCKIHFYYSKKRKTRNLVDSTGMIVRKCSALPLSRNFLFLLFHSRIRWLRFNRIPICNPFFTSSSFISLLCRLVF